MKDIIISDDIIYIGADDKDIELFENQYNVPNGVRKHIERKILTYHNKTIIFN